ncbi:MAG: 1-acyl-sn-glycerol-3-phosphate acyltransferase [Elusimicrobiota bacterium]|jgi:1-acyl-sn-glycerol-3-phosphate acyltransferase|nr:1-acyl-sn-glycerol-3-phosphate acyltransferase [Elusimicrobiota bacterium]
MPLEKKFTVESSPFLFRFGRTLFRIMFKVLCRWHIEGGENIPKTGGAIIAPNHQSFFDPPLTGSAMRRPLNFMAKEELFKVPILGFCIKRTNAFPVKRGAQDLSAMRKAFSLLKSGRLLLMFPEGTRSKNGQIGKARAGAGMVSCKAQVPLLPVKIENTNKLFRLKKIKIKFLKPIYPPANFSKDDYLKMSQKVLDKIAGAAFEKNEKKK